MIYSGELKNFVKNLHFIIGDRIFDNKFQGDNFVVNLKNKSLSMDIETDLFDIFGKFVNDNEVFLDLGANIGLFGLYAATRASGVRGYLFEQGNVVAELLAENIAINRFQ